MMELQKIETLLLQEMEDVKGGTGGTCICSSGAGQGPGIGTCECTQGGAGQKLENKKDPVCLCHASGGAAQ